MQQVKEKNGISNFLRWLHRAVICIAFANVCGARAIFFNCNCTKLIHIIFFSLLYCHCRTFTMQKPLEIGYFFICFVIFKTCRYHCALRFRSFFLSQCGNGNGNEKQLQTAVLKNKKHLQNFEGKIY